jgi:hypothetical protein
MRNAREKTRDASIAAVRAAMRVPGVPLAPHERAHFEAAFGCDLSQVRVHTDERATAAASAVNAHAFTVGRDIFFAAGAYEPATARGRTVIAHEIAHVLQDPRAVDAGELDTAVEITSPGDAAEWTAEAAVESIADGRMPQARSTAQRARIARLVAGLLDRRDANDPAQLVARLTETVRTTLSGDPDDRLGRVRRSLLNLEDRTRRLVFERLESQLVSADWHHLIDVLDQPVPAGTDTGDGRELPSDGPPEGDEEPEVGEAVETADGSKAPERAEGEPAKPDEKEAPPLAPGADKARREGESPEKDKDAKAREKHAAEHAVQRKLRGGHPRRVRKGAGARRAPAHQPVAATVPPIAAGTAPEAPEPPGPAEPVAELEPSEGAEPAGAAAQREEAQAEDREAEVAAPSPEQAAEAAPTESTAQAETAPEAAAPPSAETVPPVAEAPPPEVSTPLPGESASAEPPSATPEPPPSAELPPDTSGEAAAVRASELPAGAPSELAPPQSAEPATAGSPDATSGPPPLNDLPSEEDDGHEDTGGGGSAGGAAIADALEEAPPPAPTGDDPAAAMESVADLPPAPMQQAIGSVGTVVGQAVADDRGALANAPPEATPPAAPTVGAAERKAEAARAQSAAIAKVASVAPQRPTAAAPFATITAPLPAVRTPSVTSNADGQLTAADAQDIAESVSELPVSDPALDVTVGEPPTLALEGDADPHQADEQRGAVAKSTQSTAEEGQRDAAGEMGEHNIVPTVKAETQRAEMPAAAAAPAGPPQQPAVDRGIAAVARERARDEVRAAALSGSQDLSAKRAEQQSKMMQAREDSQRDVDKEIADNTEAQRAERGQTLAAVGGQRKEWSGEQRDLVAQADQDADQEVADARRDVAAQHKSANDEAAEHYAEGNRKIAAARNDAEKEAREKREQARNESKHEGFFSRIGHAIGSFFSAIGDAIHKAFNWARKLVSDAINLAKKLASEVIDRVRNAIVNVIRKVGDALIAIGDRVLAAFPKLRDKFRAAIHHLVDSAVAAVNKLADALKKAVKKLLDLLGKALTSILDAYEAIYMAVVNTVAAAINTAINAVKAIITAIGVFAALIRDIASNPGQWLRNLGAALLDGVRNHLWPAFKAAVKEWFNSKVEAVVGIGKLIFDVLRKGGIAFSRVAKMVWVAVKSAIPRAIIEFLIQKVISMLVPAAAAIMAIIEGLQAAWATASRVIAALDLFVTFLKAVKGGNAGPQFAKALAAAAIVVIEFTANFIISKIGKGAKGVGSRLKGIAAKIMAWLKRGVAAVKRGLKRVGRLIVGGARAASRAVRATARAIARTRIGKGIARGWAAAKEKAQDLRERFRKWRERRKASEPSSAEKKARARNALVPVIRGIAERGGSHRLLRLRYAWWRWRYKLRTLHEVSSGETSSIRMSASDEEDLFSGLINLQEARILRDVRTVASELVKSPSVRAHLKQLESERAPKKGRPLAGSPQRPMVQSPGPGMLAEAEYIASHTRQPWSKTQVNVLGAAVWEQQMWGSDVGNIVVRDPQGTHWRYDDIAARAESIVAPTAGTPAAKAIAFAEIQEAAHGLELGDVKGASGVREALAPIVRVQTIEMARNRAQIVRQVALTKLMKEGDVTIQQAIGYTPGPGQGGNLNPMARRGATRQSAFVDKDVGFDPRRTYARAPKLEDAKGFATTELNAMERYILLLARTEEPTLMREEVLERWVRRHLIDYLRRESKGYFKL